MSTEMAQKFESVDAAKLCVKCEHIATNGSYAWEQFKCFAPENLESEKLNLVNGAKIKVYKVEDCHSARKSVIYCGPKAQWYKEKPPETYLRPEGDRLVNREKNKDSSLADKL